MTLRTLRGGLLAAAVLVVSSAHIGSPDTWFSGDAGPYRVLVHVRAPGVIPGIAQVNVQVEGEQPDSVLVHVNRFDAVTAPPPPDLAELVRGQGDTYRAELWVMTSGSNSVTVQAIGARGRGAVVVPATIVASRRLDFSPSLALGLGTFGVFLMVGLVTIIGAAVRESVLPPGVTPDRRRRVTAAFAMGGRAVVVALSVFGTKRWWDYEDRIYRQSMFRPLASTAEVDGVGRALRLTISDASWRPTTPAAARTYSPLVPDHGKLMHLFAVREDLGALAHLHPESADTVTFNAALPPLPAGKYLIFGDVTHESGFAQTLAATVELESATALGAPEATASPSSGDDAWFSGAPTDSAEALLPDGSMMRWQRGDEPIVAGVPAPLRFEVVAPDRSPAALEPYMGMDGHGVVVREDGGVFIHLHPMGTVSAASQLAFELRGPADSLAGSLAPRLAAVDAERTRHAMHLGAPNLLSFPYAFPSAGRYGVWVQVKQHGQVQTAAFRVDVVDAPR